MTDTLTAEQIEYIREWAASGNGRRYYLALAASPAAYRCSYDMSYEGFAQLNTLGLTIASQAERIQWLGAENATFRAYLSGAVGALTDADDIPCGEFETVAKGIRQLTAERDKLRKAFVQACETAEEFYYFFASDLVQTPTPPCSGDIDTMRRNREEILK